MTVEGLRFRVKAEELRTHCAAKALYHSERAADKLKAMPELLKSMEVINESIVAKQSAARFSNKSSYAFDSESPAEELDKDIKKHQAKTAMFQWYAEHIFDGEYSLVAAELATLELVPVVY